MLPNWKLSWGSTTRVNIVFFAIVLTGCDKLNEPDLVKKDRVSSSSEDLADSRGQMPAVELGCVIASRGGQFVFRLSRLELNLPRESRLISSCDCVSARIVQVMGDGFIESAAKPAEAIEITIQPESVEREFSQDLSVILSLEQSSDEEASLLEVNFTLTELISTQADRGGVGLVEGGSLGPEFGF